MSVNSDRLLEAQTQAIADAGDMQTSAIVEIGPGFNLFPVTPDNIASLGGHRALYVGTAGHLVVRGAGSAADVTFKNVAAGTVLPISVSHVRATGTTAADIVAFA